MLSLYGYLVEVEPLSVAAAAAEPAVSAAQRAAEAGQANRQQGAVSAERARVVEEFRQRQRQAMLNKVRNKTTGTQACFV